MTGVQTCALPIITGGVDLGTLVFVGKSDFLALVFPVEKFRFYLLAYVLFFICVIAVVIFSHLVDVSGYRRDPADVLFIKERIVFHEKEHDREKNGKHGYFQCQ